MSDFSDKLRLKGQAEEDIYFAKRDRELIEALRMKRLKEKIRCRSPGGDHRINAYENEFREITRKHGNKPRRRFKRYRELIVRIRRKCRLL